MEGRNSFNFSSKEKLKSKKKIEELFKKSSSFYYKSFQVRYLSSDNCKEPNQILISVPKKKLKRAVHRNTVKRRIRESYRKNKFLLHNSIQNQRFSIAFVYLSSSILESNEIEKQIIECLNKIKDKAEISHETKIN